MPTRPRKRCANAILGIVLLGLLGTASAHDHIGQAGDMNVRDSRAWYILSQADTVGLLHGLPQRMASAIRPSRRGESIWQGVDEGGRLELDLRVRAEVKGEVFVGFFGSDPWWRAEPVQVRRFPGPGRYTVDRLMPGKYQLGAMIGVPPEPDALGVHAAWPAPLEIEAGRTAQARVLVSSDFRGQRGFDGQWEKMDPARMITVRTVDANGEPMPFCSVTFVDRDESRTRAFHEAGTDHLGYAYCDQIDSTFSLIVRRSDVRAPGMIACSEMRKMSKLYDARNRPTITIEWGPFPSGRGRVAGQVHDQHARPLTEYYLTLTHTDGELRDWSDCRSLDFRVPITESEGRYALDGLSAGTYSASVRHFDYPTHVHRIGYSDRPRFTIPPGDGAVVRFDIEVEAKELLYGRAVHPEGAPVYPGGWTAWFERDPASPSGGDYFSMRTKPDGSFRVALSREERHKLTANSEGMVEVFARGPSRYRLKVHVDKLSRNAQEPYLVVFPTRQPKADENALNEEDAVERPVQDDEPVQATPAAQRDKMIDQFALVATDGRTHRLSDYRGNPVLINVFTTWCGPCMQERPSLVDIQQEHAEDGLVVLAIACGEDPEVAECFASRHRMPFPVLVDQSQNGLNYDEFVGDKGQSGFPINILLDRNHHVVLADVGFNDEKLKRLRKAIEGVLGNHNRTSHNP